MRNMYASPLAGNQIRTLSVFRQLVRGTDLLLRKAHRIIEFDASADCVLRIGTRRAEREIRFGDGVVLRAGDAVAELHLWNEHLPNPEGPQDLRWAAAFRMQFERSLDRLADRIRTDPMCDGVRALMMMPALTPRQLAKNHDGAPYLLRGDWIGVHRPSDARALVHRIADDLWLWLLAWAFNPNSLIRGHFLRNRREFWISRERFLAIYGVDGNKRRNVPRLAALPPRLSGPQLQTQSAKKSSDFVTVSPG